MNITELQTASTQAEAHLTECENAMVTARSLAIKTFCKQHDLAYCVESGLLDWADFEYGAASELAQKTAAEFRAAKQAWLSAKHAAQTAQARLRDALNALEHAKAA